ncbi:MAG: universal stress protein [Bdellovibrionales bacterium]|jgi:hypothetical protein
MTEKTYLVVEDESAAFQAALHFASHAAKAAQATVTILCIVEPEGIEAWGGVERALDDEAFDAARRKMVANEKKVEEITGQKPVCVYRKGGRRAVLADYLSQTSGVTALVLGAGPKGTTQSHLIADMVGEKSLSNLPLPLIIVPEK